jgi:hypothetical protein
MKGVGRAIGLAQATFVGRPAPHRVENSATVTLIAICARAKTPIVGFDGETQSSAEAVIDLIEEVAIPVCMVGLLRALPNTQLGRRLSCMYSRCDWVRAKWSRYRAVWRPRDETRPRFYFIDWRTYARPLISSSRGLRSYDIPPIPLGAAVHSLRTAARKNEDDADVLSRSGEKIAVRARIHSFIRESQAGIQL